MKKWSSLILDATAFTVTTAAAFTTALVAANLAFIEGVIDACSNNESNNATVSEPISEIVIE